MTTNDSLGVFDSEREGDRDPTVQDPAVQGKNVALVGRFGGMNRREVTNVLRSFGACVVDIGHDSTDWVVIGADESPLAESELLDPAIQRAAGVGAVEILGETELWQRLGLVDQEQAVRKYYTPAMLAHLLDVSIRVIRRWHRRGLITPVRTLHKLPYFDFQEVATARRLANWMASGASQQAIEQRLVELVQVLPNIQRPLDQLSILVEGKQVLLRHGGGLLEPGGQLRFDFDSMNDSPKAGSSKTHSSKAHLSKHCSLVGDAKLAIEPGDQPERQDVLPFPTNVGRHTKARFRQDELLQAAYDAEDADDLPTAIDYCHAVLARDGARADVCFQLGELLYRQGLIMAARERFYMAIELDPSFVEARASLGDILVECGRYHLAIAAFRGALSLHEEYAEAHLGLAKTLERVGDDQEAIEHWRRFLELSPKSPWAEEAVERLRPKS